MSSPSFRRDQSSRGVGSGTGGVAPQGATPIGAFVGGVGGSAGAAAKAAVPGDTAKRLEEHGVSLELTAGFMERLVEEGSDIQWGARPLRRAVSAMVDDPLYQGRVCPKSQLSLQLYGSEKRLTQPLKRVGKRGDGQFVPMPARAR